jgi:hypothetical protein
VFKEPATDPYPEPDESSALIHKINKSIEQSPGIGTDSRSADQDILTFYLLTYGAEPFLRSLPVVQLLKNLTAFYGTRRFITVFTTALLSQIGPILSYLSKIYFNIVHSPTSWSSYWSLSFWLPHQCPICIPLLQHSCYMPCPSHPP